MQPCETDGAYTVPEKGLSPVITMVPCFPPWKTWSLQGLHGELPSYGESPVTLQGKGLPVSGHCWLEKCVFYLEIIPFCEFSHEQISQAL